MAWGCVIAMRPFTAVSLVVLAFLAGVLLARPSHDPAPEPTTKPYRPQSAIRTVADVHRERKRALGVIFGGALPNELPADPREIPPPLGATKALELIPGRSYYLTPKRPSGRLAIWHVGHEQSPFKEGAEPIAAMLDAGYHVIALDMPPEPHQNVTSLRPFLEPVAVSLNYAQAQGLTEAVMAGLSGGGWTTTVYAALDPRITLSVPVAGSLPGGLPVGSRDSEQDLPGLAIDYLDLYLMAASEGRTQVQVLNSDDPCCFKGKYAPAYAGFVRKRAGELGGSFDVLVVDSSEHNVPMPVLLLALRQNPAAVLSAAYDMPAPEL